MAQNFDGNGPAVRFHAGVGDRTVTTSAPSASETVYGLTRRADPRLAPEASRASCRRSGRTCPASPRTRRTSRRRPARRPRSATFRSRRSSWTRRCGASPGSSRRATGDEQPHAPHAAPVRAGDRGDRVLHGIGGRGRLLHPRPRPLPLPVGRGDGDRGRVPALPGAHAGPGPGGDRGGRQGGRRRAGRARGGPRRGPARPGPGRGRPGLPQRHGSDQAEDADPGPVARARPRHARPVAARTTASSRRATASGSRPPR